MSMIYSKEEAKQGCSAVVDTRWCTGARDWEGMWLEKRSELLMYSPGRMVTAMVVGPSSLGGIGRGAGIVWDTGTVCMYVCR